MDADTDVTILRTIIDVQRAINNADPTAAAVMKIVVDEAREATGAPGAVVELAEGDEMVYVATSGTVSGTEGLRLALTGSLSGQAVRTGEVLISEDTETDDRVDREACRKVHARSMVIVPLLSRSRTLGVTLGVLKVVSDHTHAFSDHHVHLLEQLAEFIATALRRAELMDQRTTAALTDNLTGLANRAVFLTALEQAISAAATSGQPVAVVFYLDLDGFKPINDTYGHAVGDEVLRQIARRIAATCEESDIAARLGGDEFAVLFRAADRPDVLELRDDLVNAMRAPIPTSAGSVAVGVSCGTAIVGGEDLAESVLARADAAMYADKRTRRS